MRYEEALNSCIFRYVSGSRAYGTEREDSDYDYRGVFLAPMVYSFKLFAAYDDDETVKLGVQQVQ